MCNVSWVRTGYCHGIPIQRQQPSKPPCLEDMGLSLHVPNTLVSNWIR